MRSSAWMNQNQAAATSRRALLFALLAVVLGLAPASAGQQASGAVAATAAGNGLVTPGDLQDGALRLMANKSVIVRTTRPYKRVSTAQSDIADVTPIGPSSMLVIGKKPGTTQLVLWDDSEHSQVVDVAVDFDSTALKGQLKRMFPAAQIDVENANGSLILRGTVPSLEAAEQAAQVAAPYASKVVNLMEVAGGRQVLLQVRFAEISRSASTSLGLNFSYNDGRSFGASNIGQINPFGIHQFNDESTGLGIPLSASPAVTLFGRAAMGQTTLDYFVQALRENNLLRVLAEPNLVAISGQEASFLAGGSFPIPVNGGASQGAAPAVTIEFKDYGVELHFTPMVTGDGRIRLKVAPTVSDLDFSTAVTLNGFVVPGLTTRRCSTVIEVADGQSFAIAGLLNQNVAASKDVTPLLGDIPVLGALFRSVRYQRKETELVVLVTPRLVEGVPASRMPALPGEKWRHPSETDLFLNADIGGPAKAGASPTTMPARAGDAPRFYGTYGFRPVSEPQKQQ